MRRAVVGVALAVFVASGSASAMPEVGGSGPSDLQVRGNTGAARLSVPIPVSPGTGGFAPELVLEYSSHAGDGPFGVGWQLRLPEIRRATRFGVPAYDDAVDRFELADELLVAAGGGRFHPLTETFQRVLKLGDGSWEVTETDGTAARYGTSASTRISRGAGANPIARWLLAEIEDASGNQIRFAWSPHGDLGTAYLDTVTWSYRGGSPVGAVRQVAFVYETRPDPIHAFPAGVETTLTKRVKEIVVTVGGSAFRRVVLQYAASTGYATHRSRLASVQVFGSDCASAGGAGCTGLPAQSFVYTDPSDVLASSASADWATPPSGTWVAPIPFEENQDGHPRDLGVRLADLDGDGRADIIRAYDDDGNGYVHQVWLNTGSGWENQSARAQAFQSSLASLAFTSLWLDHHDDWLASAPNATQQLAFARKGGWARDADKNTYRPPVPLRIADLNGDGRADLAAALRFWGKDEQTPTATYAAVWLNDGNGWTPGDASGLLAFESYAVIPDNNTFPGNRVCIDGTTGYPPTCYWVLQRLDEGTRLGDLNGDDLLDFVARRDWVEVFYTAGGDEPYHAKTQTRYNDARVQAATGGWVAAPGYAPPAAIVGPHCMDQLSETADYGARLVDVNGDGLTDFVKTEPDWDPGWGEGCPNIGAPATSQGASGVWLNTGSGWCDPATQCADAQAWIPPVAFTYMGGLQQWSELIPSETTYADLNGDGHPDLVKSDAVSGTRDAWLFDPSGSGGSHWKADARFKPPPGMETSSADNAIWETTGVRLADVDGDGVVDFVKSFGSNTRAAAVSSFAFADRVGLVDNGRGGTAELTYAAPAEQRDAALDALAASDLALLNEGGAGIELWSAFPVVTEVETHDALDGQTFVTSYTYAHPRYCPNHRSGTGFRLVDAVLPDDSVRRTYHWQQHGRAGQPSAEEVLDAQASPLWERLSDWVVLDGSQVGGSIAGVKVGRLVAQSERNLHGGAAGATRATTVTYNDAYGYNFVWQVLTTRPTGGLTVTRTPATANTTKWIVGLVASEVQTNGGVTYASESRTYVPGTPLLATRTRLEQPRTGSGTVENAVESWTYDLYGNRRSYTDAGNRTEYYCYDGDSQFADASGCPGGSSATHTVLTAVKDRIGGVTSFERDLGTGTVRQEVRWSGDQSDWTLDRFGRPEALVVTPVGESAITRWTRSYFDGSPTARASRELFRRIAAGSPASVRTAEYLDGFGQVVRQVREAPAGSATPAIGVAIVHDFAGRAVFQSYDQACAALDCEAIGGPGSPGIATSFDALGRPLTRTTPDGIEAFAYGATVRTPPAGGGPGGAFDWVLAKDRNGNLVRSVADGDRVAWVEECQNGVAPGATSPGADCSGPDTTFYAFEPTGEIGAIYDAVATSSAGYSDPRHRLVYRFDTLGNVLAIEDPDGGVSTMEYHATGTLASRTNARNQTTIYGYDDLDRLVAVDRPAGETDAQVTYDPRTRQRAMVLEPGAYRLDLAYDALGRRSRLVQTLNGTIGGENGWALLADWSFDLLDRPTSIAYPETNTRVVYQYQGAYLAAVCEDLADDDCASSGPAYVTGATYDALGRPDAITGPPGTLAHAYHPSTHRLASQVLTKGTAYPIDLDYTYDPVGNLTVVNDGHTPDYQGEALSSTASFGYDRRNRLVSRTLAGTTRHFRFDALGNLTGRDLASPGDAANQLYTHAEKPHAVTTAASGATYQYDASGNATRRGSSYLTFDSENRLLCEGPSAGCGSADVLFGYDLDGRRLWQKTATQTVVLFEDLAEWDKTHADVALHVLAFGRRIATKSMTSPLRRLAPARVFGLELPGDPGWLLLAVAVGGGAWLVVLGIRDGVPARIWRHPVPAAVALAAAASLALPPRAFAGGGGGGGTTVRRFLFHDHLGSNVLVTAPNGDIIHRRVFEPFGQVVAETAPTEATAQLFTGQRFEATSGLYDFRARWYDPEAGRFLSVDPVVQSASDPQTVNGYGYVRNNPVNLTDSTGKFLDGRALAFAASWGGAAFGSPYGKALADRIFNHGETISAFGANSAGALAAGAIGALSNALFNGPGGFGAPTIWTPGGYGGEVVASGGFGVSASGSLGGVLGAAADAFGKAWALPVTAIGLLIGLGGMLAGADVGIGNNAIQFTQFPLGEAGEGLTLGNVQIFPGSVIPSQEFGHYYGSLVPINLGLHEEGHTFQFQAFGILFFPLYLMSGGISEGNRFEQAANAYALGGSYFPSW
jgi:RHS repeat-associated protein